MKLILIFSMMAGSLSLWAESVYVLPAKGKAVDQGTLETITDLTKESVTQNSGFTTTESKPSADYKLRISVHKLGSSYILTGLKKAKGEKEVFRSKLKATSIEDMDTVVDRVVRSLLTEEKAKDNAQVDDVTEDEVTRGTRRKKAVKQWSFAFGPAWGKDLNTPKTSMAYNIGYNMMVDPKFDITFGFDWFIPDSNDDAQFAQFALGMDYFFNKNKNAPFVLAEFGYAFVAASDPSGGGLFPNLSSDDRGEGFSAGVGIGFKFFRTSTTNIGLVLRHSFSFAETSTTKSKPELTTFAIKVFW